MSSRDDQDIVWHLQDNPNLELSSGKNASFVYKETASSVRRGKLLHSSADKESQQTTIIKKVIEDLMAYASYE